MGWRSCAEFLRNDLRLDSMFDWIHYFFRNWNRQTTECECEVDDELERNMRGENWFDIQQCAIERRRKIDTTQIYNIRIWIVAFRLERTQSKRFPFRAVANNINYCYFNLNARNRKKNFISLICTALDVRRVLSISHWLQNVVRRANWRFEIYVAHAFRFTISNDQEVYQRKNSERVKLALR